MLIRSFKRSWFYLLISAAIAIVTSNVVFPQPLIVPYTMTGFLDNTESFLPILFAVYCSFLIPSKFEMELALVCGVKSGEFVFSKAIPVFIYTVIPCLALIPFIVTLRLKKMFRPRSLSMCLTATKRICLYHFLLPYFFPLLCFYSTV